MKSLEKIKTILKYQTQTEKYNVKEIAKLDSWIKKKQKKKSDLDLKRTFVTSVEIMGESDIPKKIRKEYTRKSSAKQWVYEN